MVTARQRVRVFPDYFNACPSGSACVYQNKKAARTGITGAGIFLYFRVKRTVLDAVLSKPINTSNSPGSLAYSMETV